MLRGGCYFFFDDSIITRIVYDKLRFADETKPVILFASRGGIGRIVAKELVSSLRGSQMNMRDFPFDQIFRTRSIVLVVSTDFGGTPVPDGTTFFRLLEDLVQDFRVDKNVLSTLRYSVVGVGSVEYGMDNFCTAARTIDGFLARLGAKRLVAPLLITDTEELDLQIALCTRMIATSFESTECVTPSEAPVLTWSGEIFYKTDEVHAEDHSGDEAGDVEELAEDGCVSKEMLTSRQRKQLEKEGYKIIGSHSAVKLCRWTKHHTRGRGGCYKHTFYGISSMNCMEATPSLACANKCVFCWRHHKNPVGTSWKWDMDPADEIVREAVALHTNLIKQLKGVPGVTPETHKEAMTVKHCALSLVGEPIMYPQINELISELHARRISTFLVTNAQFPESIRTLKPVTQLYVSVDAATPEVLQKTDRPLFADFWDRYIDSFRAIRQVTQRTVYRLTLVKEYNMADDASTITEYARLVSIGCPDFIEIKAVTFCGSDDSNKDHLTMKNVPWHEEVLKFSLALCESIGGDYQVACEHKHSCSILIALTKYRVDGIWHTWIDYDKFADLALSGREDFTPDEYWAATPEWAVYGAEERGFDPAQTRHYRK